VSWRAWAEAEGEAIRARGRWRAVKDLDAFGAEGLLEPEGRQVVSFASNDYLGLSAHPAVTEAAAEALDRWGASSTAARLIVGARPIHSALERELAEWKVAERAMLFSTGYMANLGVLSTLGTPDTTILSDELNHASIVDGCRMSRANIVVYPHNDVDFVAKALGEAGRSIVVTDAVFSMDGDAARLAELAHLCARHNALLVVDEAHAVLGQRADFGDAEVVRVGTLSKFLGSFGGFVAAEGPIVDLLINRARPFIFTTATSPADAAAALAALRILRSEEGHALVDRLRGHIDKIAAGHPSPILPIVLGDEGAARSAQARLLERGLLVPAIRPPSVPEGTSRLRITFSAGHTDHQIELLARALDETLGRVVA
jgi:8-amino-7-oxononanoate synthase